MLGQSQEATASPVTFLGSGSSSRRRARETCSVSDSSAATATSSSQACCRVRDRRALPLAGHKPPEPLDLCRRMSLHSSFHDPIWSVAFVRSCGHRRGLQANCQHFLRFERHQVAQPLPFLLRQRLATHARTLSAYLKTLTLLLRLSRPGRAGLPSRRLVPPSLTAMPSLHASLRRMLASLPSPS